MASHVRPGWDVVWLSDIPWDSLWQRPQQLATRFPSDVRILFVEPWTLGHPPAFRQTPVSERISRVSFPFLPLHARSPRLRRLFYRVGDSPAAGALFSLQRIWAKTLGGFARPGRKRLALVQNFLARPFLPALRPDRTVYDMIDAPLHFAPVPPRLVRHWEGLLREADGVSVTSEPLARLARAGGARDPVLLGNGVEVARFAGAAPARDLPGPIVTGREDGNFQPYVTVLRDPESRKRIVAEIRDWLARASAQFTYTRTLLAGEAVDDSTWLVTNRLEGDFPGGVVDLRYRFVLDGDLITALEIAP